MNRALQKSRLSEQETNPTSSSPNARGTLHPAVAAAAADRSPFEFVPMCDLIRLKGEERAEKLQ